LWLWTTNAYLRVSFDVLDAWGFEYKNVLTWVKDRFGLGAWPQKPEEFYKMVEAHPYPEKGKGDCSNSGRSLVGSACCCIGGSFAGDPCHGRGSYLDPVDTGRPPLACDQPDVHTATELALLGRTKHEPAVSALHARRHSDFLALRGPTVSDFKHVLHDVTAPLIMCSPTLLSPGRILPVHESIRGADMLRSIA